MPSFEGVIMAVVRAIEAAGVAVIVSGIALAAWHTRRPASSGTQRYTRFRQDVGRAILLGLELLVAGDIIRTVALRPTLDTMLVLALIVLVRTFLSFSLQVELDGRFPWQNEHARPPA